MCRATKDKASDRQAPATEPATAVIQAGGSIHLGQTAAELSAGSSLPLLHLGQSVAPPPPTSVLLLTPFQLLEEEKEREYVVTVAQRTCRQT